MITVKSKDRLTLTVDLSPEELSALRLALLDLISGYINSTDTPNDGGSIYWVLRFVFEESLLSEEQLSQFSTATQPAPPQIE